MAPTKREMQRLVAQRDKAHERVEFNEKYLTVAAASFDAEAKRKLENLSYKLKKQMFPLEVAATAPAIKAPELQAQAIAALEKKQTMPCKAIQQTYLRKVSKQGEAAAAAYRDKALKKLDDAKAACKAAVSEKYPLTGPAPSEADIQKYLEAKRNAEQTLASFEADRAQRRQAKLSALEKRVKKENEIQSKICSDTNLALTKLSKSKNIDIPEDSILSLRGVKMYFSGVKAVDDLSFDVKEGEIFGLIGPNGAGKSTLFNCITQFYRPTAGQVYYRDPFEIPVALTEYVTHKIVKTGIARTFQNLELVLNITVLDNLLVGAHSRFRSNLFDQFFHTKKMRDEEAVNKAQAVQILKDLNLIPYMNRVPAGLPYGILKRVELARTLMTNPRMIILDEPAAGLNDVETAELANVIRKIRDDYKCTIFLVEHDMNLVMGICDTVCAISFGQMLGVGTPKEIQANKAVQAAYLGESEDEE